MGSLLPTRAANASSAAAASAYQRGDYAEAQREYSAAAARDPAQPLLKFNAGTAAYKAGDFPAAAREFKSSLDAAKSGSAQRLAEQEDAYYNLGNTLYREGQKSEKTDAKKTIDTWTSAVKAYDAALQLRTDDADSKFNRDLVSRKLDQLKKQQQSQSQQGQKDDKDKSKDPSQGSQNQPQSAKNGGQPQQGQQPPQQGQQQNQSQNQQQAQQNQQQGQQNQQQGQQSQGQQQNQPNPSSPQQTQGQPGEQGQPQPPRQGQATADAGKPPEEGPNGGGAQNGDEARRPGEMSPEEARELLDSVKDEERRAPIAASAGNSEAEARPTQEPRRDW
jgi:Ca-activated chloride channel family protein